MSDYTEGRWAFFTVGSASEDRRRWEDKRGLVRQRVRGYRGWVIRKLDRKDERKNCGHVHNKQSAARKCAERYARHLNREEVRNINA